jgi:hypothetical protein
MLCYLSAHFYGEADEDTLFLFLPLLYPRGPCQEIDQKIPTAVTSADDASNLGGRIVSAPPFLFTLECI